MAYPSVDISGVDNSEVVEKSQNYRVFYGGYFNRGEVNTIIPVYDVLDFKIKFGKPDSKNLNDWYQIYNYFQYDNNEILIGRVIGDNSYNASYSYPFDEPKIRIDNYEMFKSKAILSNKNFIRIIAKNPGEWGNSISVALFSNKQYVENSIIFNHKTARDFIDYLPERYVCLIVFYESNPVEIYTLDYNDLESINDRSEYIYIKFDPKRYHLYDGNIHYVDGNIILANGNEINKSLHLFFNNNIAKLKDGFSELPNKDQVQEVYDSISLDESVDISFYLCNSQYPEAAIAISEKYGKSISFGNKSSIRSKNAIIYDGNKKQTNIFNGKKIWVSIIGDILGIKTNISNNIGLSESHSKIEKVIKNIDDYDLKANDFEGKELYYKNINILRKNPRGGYHSFFENMYRNPGENSDKLTNRFIFITLKKECEALSKYFLFEFNDSITRNDLKSKMIKILESYKRSNCIQDFQVVCDESNQKAPNEITCDVFYQPKYLVENIKIRLISKIEI